MLLLTQLRGARGTPASKLMGRFLLVMFGCLITAVGVNAFLVPHNLLTAGVSGIAMLAHYLVPSLGLGIWVLILNIPIFILGWFMIDRPFTLWSLVGMVGLSVSLEITAPLADMHIVKDLYMALIAGGVVAGIGVGMTFRARASMGGTDIIAAILRRKYSMTIGTAQTVMNVVIVMVLGLQFSLEKALASAFSIFAESWAMDKAIMGLETNKALMIVTEKPQEVTEGLMARLRRGVTLLDGHGGYLGDAKQIVYCIISPRQLSIAKGIIEDIDPHSFTTVTNTVEVLGQGFKRSAI